MNEMIGDVEGLHILDLGCGTASYGHELLARGASFYSGVDGSSNMIACANENLKGMNAEVIHATLEDWEVPIQKGAGFDVQQIRESKPSRNNFIHQETYERRLRIPLFLFMTGRKVG